MTAKAGELVDVERELERTTRELREKTLELERVTQELADTNRGVLALYGEIDQRAELLAQASEAKSRFLSFMSHEFRTPLSAVLSLSELLLMRADGPLTEEQEKQIELIRSSTRSLARLVDDLLDLSKVESGKMDIRVVSFEVDHLFAALRGILRNVPRNDGVELRIEEPSERIRMETDEDKLAQVLRNLVANSLKFTEKGHVVLRSEHLGDDVRFECVDTGIGISREDQDRIFSEFSQIDSGVQRRVRGTGLGLSISRKLTVLLGGSLEVESELGRGSIFRVTVPRVLPARIEGRNS